jgi:hypothetical protein
LSNYFGYQAGGGYFAADTLAPGNGYWVKVNNPGILILTAGTSTAPRAAGKIPSKSLPAAGKK